MEKKPIDHRESRLLRRLRPRFTQEEPTATSPRMAEVKERRSLSTGRLISIDDLAQKKLRHRLEEKRSRVVEPVQPVTLSLHERAQRFKMRRKQSGTYESLVEDIDDVKEESKESVDGSLATEEDAKATLPTFTSRMSKGAQSLRNRALGRDPGDDDQLDKGMRLASKDSLKDDASTVSPKNEETSPHNNPQTNPQTSLKPRNETVAKPLGTEDYLNVGSWATSAVSFQTLNDIPQLDSNDLKSPPNEPPSLMKTRSEDSASSTGYAASSIVGNDSEISLNPIDTRATIQSQRRRFNALPPPPPPPGHKPKRRSKKKSMAKTTRSIPVLTEVDETTASDGEANYRSLEKQASGSDKELSDQNISTWELRKPDYMSVKTRNSRSFDRGVSESINESYLSPETALSDQSSPASISALLNDLRLAEKVDKAISVAAEKFEMVANDSSYTLQNTSAFDRNKSIDLSFQETSFVDEQKSHLDSDRTEWNPKNLHIFPDFHPSPFEAVVFLQPKVIGQILDFLGDPVAVTRTKSLNRVCKRYVDENEYRLMRDAVRLGGLRMSVRPYFWMWITLQKWSDEDEPDTLSPIYRGDYSVDQLKDLERRGLEGKWHGVIERDVTRSFGNLPPHKTGARLRTDSIIRALVTWGRSRFMPRGIKGTRDAPPPSKSYSSDDSEATPTDTVSDWGGVTPVGSFASEMDEEKKMTEVENLKKKKRGKRSNEEMALSANILTDEVKESLQHKLSFILHCLSTAHGDVGYCQGMDYVVAHLLRILQDTIRWKTVTGTMPSSIRSVPKFPDGRKMSPHELKKAYAQVDESMVVEETCFRVMDTFMSTYELRHFYWPELRCLKTCCRVFEKLIQIKLPVLAEHMEYHELNVGLFALGWFQTLFLYLPSMPSATVCHMWDIWLVERSFKIFFRVATAILFLSQPILLNHELEGMMGYLNTFPDATLLSPDILIHCALQIKITNKMLMDIEKEVMEEMM